MEGASRDQGTLFSGFGPSLEEATRFDSVADCIDPVNPNKSHCSETQIRRKNPWIPYSTTSEMHYNNDDGDSNLT